MNAIEIRKVANGFMVLPAVFPGNIGIATKAEEVFVFSSLTQVMEYLRETLQWGDE